MRWIVGAAWIASACGPVVTPEGDGTTGEDTTGNSTTASTTAPFTTSGPPDPSTSPSTTQGTDPSDPTVSTSGNPTMPDPTIDPDETGIDPCGDFIGCFDFSSDGGGCDVWAQDCAEGEKCMPWANDGGIYWNSVRCSPDQNLAHPGDACVVEGSYVSGIDNCALGSMCLFVDPKTNEGTCVANCGGSEANPTCDDPQNLCAIDFDGVMINCLAACNPLLQDCIEGGCSPTFDNFVCAPTIGLGMIAGAPCGHDWDCVPGTACLPLDLVPMCEGESCCAPICDLAVPGQCEDQVCLPWFEEGQAPPGLEQVGVCVEA